MLDNRVSRWLGGAAMVGAVLAVVFNLLHPRAEEVTEIRSVIATAADEGIWVLDHYILAWTVMIALLAFVAITRSLVGEPSRSWARVALPFGVGSAFLAFSAVLIDGWAVKESAEQAGDLAVSVAYVGEALFIGTIWAFFGIVPLLFGATLLSGSGYHPLLGWTPVVSGAIGVITSTIVFFDGFTSLTFNVLFPVSSLLFTLWIGAMGYRLWTGSEEPVVASAPIT